MPDVGTPLEQRLWDLIRQLGLEVARLNAQQGRVPVVASTPAELFDGQVWLNASDGKLYWRVGGTTHSVGP